ncbi:MAG TPA: phosphatase PAP2 family protein [Anaeromyxobacter sp.]
MRSRSAPLALAVAGVAALAARPAVAAETDAAAPPPSVYRVNLAVDGPVLGAAAAAALVPYVLQDRIVRERCPCDVSEIPRFERFVVGYRSNAADIASDTLAALSVAVPATVEALALGWGRPLLEDGVVLAETVLVNGAIVTTVKDLVQRPTPRAYAGDAAIVSRPTGYRAFYSGHTSLTVAALTAAAWTWRFRRGPAAWPWVVVAAGGAGVGALRIAGGNHFPTDVAAAAVAGLAVGTAVPLLHHRRGHALALVPAPGGLGIAGDF